jgi:hypothetical protein
MTVYTCLLGSLGSHAQAHHHAFGGPLAVPTQVTNPATESRAEYEPNRRPEQVSHAGAVATSDFGPHGRAHHGP